MIINLTEAQKKKVRAIVEKYQPQIDELLRKDKTENLPQLQALYDSRDTEVNLLCDKYEAAYFKRFKGDATAILNNAQEQIPLILENVYNDFFQYAIKEDAEIYKKQNIGHFEKDRFYMFTDAAVLYIKEELQLHIKAFESDPDNLQKLLGFIRSGAENSPYTKGESDNKKSAYTEAEKDSTEILITEYRRRPLSDIKRYGLMNDKVNAQLIQGGEMFRQNADGQLQLLWVVNQAPAKQEPVPVSLALTYEGTEELVNKKLTAFDFAVYNAISTRYYYEHKANPQEPLRITPEEVWRTMNGKDPSDGRFTPSEKQIKRICASIDKMRYMLFYMDITQEIEKHHLTINDERIIKGEIETYVLNADKCQIHTEKGQVLSGYVINREPILYTYNMAKGRILYVPYDILNISSKKNDVENMAEFKGYLMQQIQLMKNAREKENKGKYFNRSDIILVDTIYNDTGILPPEERIEGGYANEATRQQIIRRNRKADREKIEGILDAWIEKKWIKGYEVLNAKKEPVKAKQPVKAYKILL